MADMPMTEQEVIANRELTIMQLRAELTEARQQAKLHDIDEQAHVERLRVIDSLKAELAETKADADKRVQLIMAKWRNDEQDWTNALDAEQRAHAETKAALERKTDELFQHQMRAGNEIREFTAKWREKRSVAQDELDRARPVLEAMALIDENVLRWWSTETGHPGQLCAQRELTRRAAEKAAAEYKCRECHQIITETGDHKMDCSVRKGAKPR